MERDLPQGAPQNLVVVGASAGGVEALTALAESHLPGILRRASPLPAA